jgi:MoaA/NifB/PqqE/SkfB family radical SAM enzyme
MPEFHFSVGRELAIMFARTCNIACKHCGIESSPENKERMTLEQAESIIVSAASIPDFKKITFTGGEPLMFPKEHVHLLRLCRDLGLMTRIVTNGFWAKTPKRGRALLAELCEAGLTELNFSADAYHLEFQDKAILASALKLAAEVGLARIVSFVSNGSADPLSEFASLYDLPREKLLDLRKIPWDRREIDRLKDDHIFVFYGGLIGLGRAAMYPEILRYYPLDFFPFDAPCREIVDKPVVYPDGSFQACCCAGGKIGSFTVGNAFSEDLGELYDKMQKRPHFRLINTHGPRQLFDCVKAARPDLRLPREYTSICELCVRASQHLSAAEVDTIAEAYLWQETFRCFSAPELEEVAG